jgi:anaerobic selenocysteine-containing dehydrogenase
LTHYKIIYSAGMAPGRNLSDNQLLVAGRIVDISATQSFCGPHVSRVRDAGGARMTAAVEKLDTIRGACGHDCPDTCGWVVEVRNGAAERLSGDPTHPFTRGTLCAKVNHYLERVYHADRVLHPLKRVGAKGEGRFARVSWDGRWPIASRWQAIVAESGAGDAAIQLRRRAGPDPAGLARQRLFGSMGTAASTATSAARSRRPDSATLGVGTGIDPGRRPQPLPRAVGHNRS